MDRLEFISYIFIGFLIGFLIGFIFTLSLIDCTIEKTIYADKLLNSGEYSIDTIYTINKADTTIKYKFIKIQK